MLITLTIWHDKEAENKKNNSKRYYSTPYILLTGSIGISM